MPVIELLVFVPTGLVVYGLSLSWPRRGRWLAARFMCVLTLLPMVLVALPRIYFWGRLLF
jgi:hypothetical protein